MTATAVVTRCTACGGTDLRDHLPVGSALGSPGLIPTTDAYGTALEDIVRCDACGHMQLAAFPAGETLLGLYEQAESEHYLEEEAGQRQTARAALDRIERWVPRGRLLDLGCWVGFLLAEARERGWDVTGVEPSGFAADYAQEVLGLDVRREDILTADLPDAAFDAIVLGDVVEHLVDPAAALERIAGLLAPGGVVYMALPDAGSTLARRMGRRWWSVLPTHVQYFTRSSMRTLLDRQGWETVWIGTAPKTFSVRYYLWRIGGYSRSLSGSLVRAADAAGVADRPWAPDFRDRMAIIARRAA
jgi:SAM-dependent methyltransferase